MLSGSPPFSGNDTMAVLDAVRHAQLSFDQKDTVSDMGRGNLYPLHIHFVDRFTVNYMCIHDLNIVYIYIYHIYTHIRNIHKTL